MFAGYNKGNTQGTLTGNWVEEDALRESTGNSRYKEWIDGDGLVRASERKQDGSHLRVIQHSDAENPSNYRSTSNVDSPSKNQEHRVEDKFGPRQRQKEKKMYERAKKLQSGTEGASVNYFDTTSKASYRPIESSYIIQQPRVLPRGRNGGKTQHDSDYTTVSEREAADRELLANFKSNSYTRDAAISKYSHAILKNNGLDFPVSAASTTNPFAKSTSFTNDIRDGRRIHAEATDPGQSQAIPSGYNIHQRSILTNIVAFLRQNGTEQTALYDQLIKMDSSGNEKLSFQEFEAGIRECGMNYKTSDIKQV